MLALCHTVTRAGKSAILLSKAHVDEFASLMGVPWFSGAEAYPVGILATLLAAPELAQGM